MHNRIVSGTQIELVLTANRPRRKLCLAYSDKNTRPWLVELRAKFSSTTQVRGCITPLMSLCAPVSNDTTHHNNDKKCVVHMLVVSFHELEWGVKLQRDIWL